MANPLLLMMECFCCQRDDEILMARIRKDIYFSHNNRENVLEGERRVNIHKKCE